MIIGSAEVLIEPTSRGFAAQLESDLTPAATNVGKKLGAALAAAISIREVASFFKSTVDEASNAEEAASKVDVVFGEASQSVIDFASNSADAFGQSKNQALEATGTFGNLFRAIELTETQSASMSTTLTGLASDLASFNNTDVDEALTALRSGLVGETEPLKRFGVNLNDARLRAEALALGLDTTGATLDANVKAQAAYSLILRDTALAQGDFARTSGGLANQTRSLQAEFADAKTEIGTGLLPVAKELVETARGDLIPTLVDLATATVPLLIEGFEAAEPIIGITTQTLTALAPALEAVADVINAIPDPLLNAAVLSYGLGRAYTSIGTSAVNAGRDFATVDWSGPLEGGSRAAGGFRSSLRGMTTGVNGVAATFALATTAVSLWSSAMEEGRERAEEFGEDVRSSVTSEITASSKPFDVLEEKLAAVRDGVDDLSETFAGSSAPWDIDFRRELAAGIEELGQTEDQLVALRDETERLARIYDLTENQTLLLAQANGIDLAEATDESRRAFGDAVRATRDFGDGAGTATGSVEELTEALKEEEDRLAGVNAQLADLVDAQLDAFGADLNYDKAVANLADSLADYEIAVAEAKAAAAGRSEADEAAIDAVVALGDAETAASRAKVDALDKVREAEARAADARSEFGASSDAAIKAERDLADARLDLRDTERDVARDVADAREGLADAEEDASEAGIEAARNLRDAFFDLRGDALDLAEAAAAVAEAQAEAAGGTLEWADKNTVLRDELQDTLNTIGPDSPLRGELEALIDNLDNVANTYIATVVLEAQDAIHDLAELNAGLQAYIDTIGGLRLEGPNNAGGVLGLLGAADGFAGTVSSPTVFLTGEGGQPEDVLVVPQSLGGISKVVGELAAALGGAQQRGSFGRSGMVMEKGAIQVFESGGARKTAVEIAKEMRAGVFRGGISGLVN